MNMLLSKPLEDSLYHMIINTDGSETNL